MYIWIFCIAAALCPLSKAARAKEIPAGAELHVRLTTDVASDTARVGDAVEAVAIVPLVLDSEVLIPSGSVVRGTVGEVQKLDEENNRAVLSLEFSQVEISDDYGIELPLRVSRVDNARESVDEMGKIVGILPGETWSARMDQGLERLSDRFSKLASILRGAKNAMVEETQPEIRYFAGVEMVLTSTQAVEVEGSTGSLSDLEIEAVRPEDELMRLVNAQPFQTMAENPSKPSDITNLMFLGTEDEVAQAFELAGWTTAAELSGESKMETFRAIVEARGYSEAPVSVLLLEDKKPDMVFQKQLNTFAMRHHLRIWRRPDSFNGRTVWVSAATHDVGIEFSPENRTFIHKIDSNIDRERAKVVLDLLFTGMVEGLSLVERPEVPEESENATGDVLSTDGRMAVLAFTRAHSDARSR